MVFKRKEKKRRDCPYTQRDYIYCTLSREPNDFRCIACIVQGIKNSTKGIIKDFGSIEVKLRDADSALEQIRRLTEAVERLDAYFGKKFDKEIKGERAAKGDREDRYRSAMYA